MSKLQEIYIKKYISCKDYNIILKTMLINFEDVRYQEEYSIINPELDLILYIMSKSEFLGLLRNTIIVYNGIKGIKDEKITIDDKCKLLSKKDIINNYVEKYPSFLLYLITSLYTYI